MFSQSCLWRLGGLMSNKTGHQLLVPISMDQLPERTAIHTDTYTQMQVHCTEIFLVLPSHANPLNQRLQPLCLPHMHVPQRHEARGTCFIAFLLLLVILNVSLNTYYFPFSLKCKHHLITLDYWHE